MYRKISWLVGALAYIAPPTWAYLGQASLYAAAKAEGQYMCGLPMLAFVSLACIGAAGLSGMALLFGWLSYRMLPRPRAWARGAELAVLAAPMLLGVGFVAILFSM